MAKENVSILERHVEKAVIGVAGLVLLGAVVMYGIMQPNTQQAGSDVVTPSSVDERVADAAERVKRAISTANPEPVALESAVPRLEQYRNVLASGGLLGRLPGIVPWQPSVPDVGRIVPQEGEILLTQVAPPSKPIVTTGRSTLELFPAVEIGEDPGSNLGEEESTGYIQPVGWASLTTTFDFGSQKLAMKRAGYGPGFSEPMLVGLEVQRREQRFDGTWSDDDWNTIQQTRVFKLPEPPVVKLETQQGKVMATPESRDKAQAYWELISSPEVQVEAMRPWFPKPVNGSGWKPVTLPGIALTKLDNELLETDLEPAGPKTALRDYKDLDIEAQRKVLTDAEQVKEWKAQIETARKQKDWDKAIETAQLLAEFIGAKENERKDAEKMVADFTLEKDKAALEGPKGSTKPGTQPVKRQRSDLQMVWAHDAGVSSLHGGHTYQYRARARLHNNYLANPGYLKVADDAIKPFVLGEWSEPSDPITIPPGSMFFVDRGDAERKQIRVNAFQWAHGVWVDTKIEVSPGERISKIDSRPVPFEERPKAIMFNTGSTALDVDFARTILEEKNFGKGDFESKPSQTVALVYLDDQGNVCERLALLDKRSPDQQKVNDVVFDEKAAAKLAQQKPTDASKEQPGDKGAPPPSKGGKGGRGGKRGGGGGR